MIKTALAHIADSRPDFLAKRQELVDEELGAIDWLRSDLHPVESGLLFSHQTVAEFGELVCGSGAQSLIIHLPVWGDPIFSLKLAQQVNLPVLLLGNNRPDTSSMVGLLGAGGALDQVGCDHFRVFEHSTDAARRSVLAFTRAAAARQALHGQTLGLFGGRSLGIFTTIADPAQWQRLFGVDIEVIDQAEIVRRADDYTATDVETAASWLTSRLGGVSYGNGFTPVKLEKQMRSYLATRDLVQEYALDFVGVKCQPELSDGYVTQCIAHMLCNSQLDPDGARNVTVHACEADADGALTMQIMKLISGGQPAALLDLRWLNPDSGLWTLANCGAIPPALAASPADASGLGAFHMQPHVFGLGGGGALSGLVPPQRVTLARLCRNNGQYWMAILSGETVTPNREDALRVTPAFPKAFVRCPTGPDFLEKFGSNHIHMLSGDWTPELQAFCRLSGIPCQTWN